MGSTCNGPGNPTCRVCAVSLNDAANSGTMMFLPIAVYFGATYGASPATQTVLAEMILPPSLTVSSIMLLGAGVIGLTGYAMMEIGVQNGPTSGS